MHCTCNKTLTYGHCQILVYLFQIELLVPLTRYFKRKCRKMCKKQCNIILQKCHHRQIFSMSLGYIKCKAYKQIFAIIVLLKWFMAHKSSRWMKGWKWFFFLNESFSHTHTKKIWSKIFLFSPERSSWTLSCEKGLKFLDHLYSSESSITVVL